MDVQSEIENGDLADGSSLRSGEEDEVLNEEELREIREGKCPTYRFRMRHFFYMHLFTFIVVGLLAGLIIYLIENKSASKNRQIEVSYINAWFVSCTCMYGCGLTTLNFAKLSKVSQILLLVFTFLFGITVSTFPALAIKAYTHKHIQGITVDTDHGKEVQNSENDNQNSTSSITNRYLPPELEKKIALLPTSRQIRYWAYLTVIIFIFLTNLSVYVCYFIIVGAWLDVRYSGNKLTEGNSTISPWYTSAIIVITGFNQNGLTPFSDSMARFVHDVYINIFVMMVVLCGSSLYPFLLRNIIFLGRRLIWWRYKIVFDYIVLNHHHLTTLLFPTLQTRIYLCVTSLLHLMAILISLILDIHNSHLAPFAPGTRFLIFVFHSISSRFAGFQTVDISQFTSGILIIYLLLMITKPQMLCTLSKSRVELTWISLQKNQADEEREQSSSFPNSHSNAPVLRKRSPSTASDEAFVQRYVNSYLKRRRLAAKERASEAKNSMSGRRKSQYVSRFHYRLFLLKFTQTIFKHVTDTLASTYTWLFIFIFLICAIEGERIVNDPNITVFKVIFEVISAFGCVGLSLGYPGVSSSFATVLSPTSRVIVGLTMLMGRHRGLLASMKDQEEIEHSANDLLEKWKRETIEEYETSEQDSVLTMRF